MVWGNSKQRPYWHGLEIVRGIGKDSVAKAMGFPSIQAMDRAICAVDCKPIHAAKGAFLINAGES
jgi:hypothetical protein